MKYNIPMYNNKQIEEMEDNQLYNEIVSLKRLIQKIRRNGDDTRDAEEEISYLQVEAQNRGFGK